ncbi:MAG TPA: nucleotide sugar dehydrogenase [Acidimicrobiia bacterium]
MNQARLDNFLRRVEDRSARVVLVGQGYVGLPVALRASEVGFPVVGFDTSTARVDSLRNARSYVEDVSEESLEAALARGYSPSADPADAAAFDIAVITVPTPLREGVPDLTFIESAANMVAGALRAGALVVLESTTYPGTTAELVGPILERQSGLRVGTDFFLGYSPERIDPGNPMWGLRNTPKVVSGIDHDSRRATEAFYGSLVDKVVPVGSTAEAELVKLLENTFRHVNIALVNELAMFARDLGVDIWSAIDATSTKPFGYMRFTPGPGVGGHCLPIDPSYLAWSVEQRLGRPFRFVELANDVNSHMPDYVVSRVVEILNGQSRSVRGSRILVVGLAYKAGTSDWRESPSTRVIRELVRLGADVRVHDDHVPVEAFVAVEVPAAPCDAAELAAADLVVLLVDHPDLPIDEICSHASLVFDTKGALRDREFPGEML